MMAVFWKTNHFKADAEEAYKEIMTLDEITAENVVELARSESSVIHDEFEWDDAVAGAKWRHKQAQTLLCNLVVEANDEKEPSEPVRVRVLYNIPDTSDYKPIQHFITHEDDRVKLLNKAIQELRSFEIKYRTLTELQKVFDAINEL